MKKMINGISVCNPVDIKRDYLLYTVDYAKEHNIDHIQFIGPIHNPVKGNIDGMTMYRKYSQFNDTKDITYLENTKDYINEACKIANKSGIKTYVWHHELEVPPNFIDTYPEIKNATGDVEITHPIIKDFLENKIKDFFTDYPLIDGIILTLHETRIPLLKLKNQKLSKIERVKYVTKILYDTCKSLGKELICRTFASLEEDYEMMLSAFEEISPNLLVMDKWTQFDWSLTLPHNQFFKKIKNNPLFVETDIFGEFFGKGRLPLMLKEHIKEKFDYCMQFAPKGFVSRVDRGMNHPFGEVNEVNINIMNAYMSGQNVDEAIFDFFKEKYPNAAKEVMELMEPTEEILRSIIYLKGFYFSELSAFPSLNHCKNHFYFEMMRDNYCIASDEWFIPAKWDRGSIEGVIGEKQNAADSAAKLFADLETMKDKINKEDFDNLYLKFANLKYTAAIWFELTKCFIHYTKYFETKDIRHKDMLMSSIEKMRELNRDGIKTLGNRFYCTQLDIYDDANDSAPLVEDFATELIATLEAEEKKANELDGEGYVDYVICGGANESHKLMKEVCFSDTGIKDGNLYRIPGNKRGSDWSTVSTHGWFSYEVNVTPKAENTICIAADCDGDNLDFIVTIDDKEHNISQAASGKAEICLAYTEQNGNDCVRIRIDRASAITPFIYSITVK